jgi:hypothetical protein
MEIVRKTLVLRTGFFRANSRAISNSEIPAPIGRAAFLYVPRDAAARIRAGVRGGKNYLEAGAEGEVGSAVFSGSTGRRSLT